MRRSPCCAFIIGTLFVLVFQPKAKPALPGQTSFVGGANRVSVEACRTFCGDEAEMVRSLRNTCVAEERCCKSPASICPAKQRSSQGDLLAHSNFWLLKFPFCSTPRIFIYFPGTVFLRRPSVLLATAISIFTCTATLIPCMYMMMVLGAMEARSAGEPFSVKATRNRCSGFM